MTDIFLFSGEANPQDIKLRDPTTSGGVTTITGTLAATDGADTAAFLGVVEHVGILSATDGVDVFVADGTVTAESVPNISAGVPGRGRPRIHRPIAVVEYDGRDYRVPLDKLDDFLELVKKKAETPEPVKVVKKKKKKTLKVSPQQPPKLVIKSAPPEFLMEFEQFVDRSNEILDKIWQGMISRALAELDDEEAILLTLL